MALVNIGGTLDWPPMLTNMSSGPGFGSSLIDASGEIAACVLQAPKAGNIRKFHIKFGSVSTGATVDVRMETIDGANGQPTGTLFGTNTNAALVVDNTDDNEVLVATLTADGTVTKGQEFAVAVVRGASGVMNLHVFDDHFSDFPYIARFTGGVWSKVANAPCIAVEYSDGTIMPIPGVIPHETDSNVTSNTTTLRGNLITSPFACRVTGYWFWASSWSGAPVAQLIDEDGTTVSLSDAIDPQVIGAGGVVMRRMFNGTKVLAAGEPVYIVMRPDGASNVLWRVRDYDSQALREGAENGGSYIKYVTAAAPTGPGDWTPTETRQAYIGLLIDQLDDGTGGGGGGPPANLLGGIFQ